MTRRTGERWPEAADTLELAGVLDAGALAAAGDHVRRSGDVPADAAPRGAAALR
ncbi:MAG TPA: hypothetical protein VFQ77_13430 [Pseudonocardiaceae bacterium]|nr:hypothetical protein [Pseudonocardiaceae bacterium]